MEYTTHDEINLVRLVRRLEKSVATPDEWNEGNEWIWLKAQKDLQKVKYARKLVKNVETYDEDALLPAKIKQRNELLIKLDKVEVFLKDVHQRTLPPTNRPAPLLPSIPKPEFSPPEQNTPLLSSTALFSPPSLPPSPLPPSFPPLARTSPSTTTALAPTNTDALIPRKPPTSTPSNPAHTSLQSSLSLQLSQMATQLKRNAEHFQQTLEKDNALLQITSQKIEENYDAMGKARVMLKDLTGKSGGTTWLVVAIVMCVLGVFVAMVGVIRFSRF
ncbi:uncharacterized protein LACBIDRAFT_314363 [Laccaria bicolor S238N-H82]|uniref:Predicted protein n=1 Tax=Laccaria bicolor (strain S238N-H82 / ATCC MYA-4686) TaxID=486041 RepID=B0DYD8_LACBS|nr:uncharacterized protein LACBIDRAFT_314363 [Laccaria bicolor S238N-H82]EDR00417.1 predicted protein [Laccaria bicolor S238N-H82]|eukprot:XP_001888976.1 predicted protein [Laccaria bicolor S238N-H82]